MCRAGVNPELITIGKWIQCGLVLVHDEHWETIHGQAADEDERGFAEADSMSCSVIQMAKNLASIQSLFQGENPSEECERARKRVLEKAKARKCKPAGSTNQPPFVDWGVGALVWCNVESTGTPVARPGIFRGRFLPLLQTKDDAKIEVSPQIKPHKTGGAVSQLTRSWQMVEDFKSDLEKLLMLCVAQSVTGGDGK